MAPVPFSGALLVLGWVIWSLGLQGRSCTVFATLSIATTAVLTGLLAH